MNQSNANNDVSIKRIGGIVMQVAGPALAILVVCSIAFFLIEICYDGPFVERIKWIFALFSFAAVLISRISIEEGFERATVFGFFLGIATLIVSARFMQGNPVYLVGIIVFVWWAAGRLTWDCTFIDETRDATGQGMIDLAIDRINRFRTGEKSGARSSTRFEPIPDPDLVQGADPAADKKNPNAWDHFVRIFWKRKQANTPGLWAFYFLLLGLPLFGIGQLMMRMNDAAGHRAAAFHFFFYVAGLLGLLMLSSVLGLHRYLQKNQSSMPGSIARRWITAGTILAIGITGFCFMLPRPTAKYSIGNWLPKLTTSNTTPSDQSMGDDGQQQSKKNSNLNGGPNSRDNRSKKRQDNNDPGGGNAKKSDDGSPTDTKAGKTSGGKSSDGKKGSGGPKKQNPKGKSRENDGKQKGSGGQSEKKSKHKSNEGESEKGEPEKGDSADEKSDKQKSLKSSAEKQKQASQKEKKSGGGASSRNRSSRSRPSEANKNSSKRQKSDKQKSASGFGQFLARLFKLVVWVVALLVLVWFAIKYRSQIMPWIRSFLAEMAEFWHRLWNREKKTKPTRSSDLPERKRTVRLPGFSQFRNPFSTDAAQTWPPDRLVQYTFEAFEAWSRDHDCAREPDQTANEFAQATLSKYKPLTEEATYLANLYSQLAYAKGTKGTITRSAAMALSPLWEKLTMMYSPVAAASA